MATPRGRATLHALTDKVIALFRLHPMPLYHAAHGVEFGDAPVAAGAVGAGAEGAAVPSVVAKEEAQEAAGSMSSSVR
eukprot:1360662-Rhodomonas_salina.1